MFANIRVGGGGRERPLLCNQGGRPTCLSPHNFYLRRSRQVIKRWKLLLLLLGDCFEVMTLKVDLQGQGQGQLLLLSSLLYLPPWFSFGVGSVALWSDFSSGWGLLLPDQISLRGGIHCFQTKFLFGVGSRGFCKKISSLSFIFLCLFIISPMRGIPLFYWSFLFSTPQLFEQSLFLFLARNKNREEQESRGRTGGRVRKYLLPRRRLFFVFVATCFISCLLCAHWAVLLPSNPQIAVCWVVGKKWPKSNETDAS